MALRAGDAAPSAKAEAKAKAKAAAAQMAPSGSTARSSGDVAPPGERYTPSGTMEPAVFTAGLYARPDLEQHIYGFDGPSMQAWRSPKPLNKKKMQMTDDLRYIAGASKTIQLAKNKKG